MVKNFKKTVKMNVKGMEISYQVNKNGSICNIDPRCGELFSSVYGTPEQIGVKIINQYFEED